jgi:hypothetical protein
LRDAAHQQGTDPEMTVVGGGSRDRTLEGARPQSRSPSDFASLIAASLASPPLDNSMTFGICGTSWAKAT